MIRSSCSVPGLLVPMRSCQPSTTHIWPSRPLQNPPPAVRCCSRSRGSPVPSHAAHHARHLRGSGSPTASKPWPIMAAYTRGQWARVRASLSLVGRRVTHLVAAARAQVLGLGSSFYSLLSRLPCLLGSNLQQRGWVKLMEVGAEQWVDECSHVCFSS